MHHVLNHDLYPSVAQGERRGRFIVNKFGRNIAVGTTFAPLAYGGVYQTPQGAAATALRIKAGGHANDTAAGSGAREITIEGLDDAFELCSAPLITNGALASDPSTQLFARAFRAYVSASGTYATMLAGSHADDIVIESAAGGADWLTISADGFPRAQTEAAVYTIPAGHTGYLVAMSVFTDSTRTTETILFQRERADDAAPPYAAMRMLADLTQQGGKDTLEIHGPMKVVGPADVGFMTKVSSGPASVHAELQILVVSDTAP